MSTDTYYEVLGIPPEASSEEIRSAYRRLSLQVHPDRGGSGALFRSVVEAYEVLSDPDRRAAYDVRRRTPGRGFDGESWDGESWDDESRDDASRDDASWDEGFRPGGPQWAPPPIPMGGSAPRGIWRTVDAHPAGALLGLGGALVCLGRLGDSSNVGLVLAGLATVLLGLVAVAGSRSLIRRTRVLGGEGDPVDVLPDAQFLQVVERLFVRSGFRVRSCRWLGGPVADLLVERNGRWTVVQVSRSRGPVGSGAVHVAARTAATRAATGAIVLTNGMFTADAWEAARVTGVVLWDRAALLAALYQAGMVTDAGWVHSTGLAGGTLLAAELRAGFPVVARMVAIVVGVLVAATALRSARTRSRSSGHR